MATDESFCILTAEQVVEQARKELLKGSQQEAKRSDQGEPQLPHPGPAVVTSMQWAETGGEPGRLLLRWAGGTKVLRNQAEREGIGSHSPQTLNFEYPKAVSFVTKEFRSFTLGRMSALEALFQEWNLASPRKDWSDPRGTQHESQV